MTEFVLAFDDHHRVWQWSWFLPENDTRLIDYALCTKLERSFKEGGGAKAPITLSIEEAWRLRGWFEYVPDSVLDESDHALVGVLAGFLSKYRRI